MDNNIELVYKAPGIPPDITELENLASIGENYLIILVLAAENVILNLPPFIFCPKF